MDKKSMRYTTLYNIVGPNIANIEREIERIEIELQQLEDGKKFRERLRDVQGAIESTINQYQGEIPKDIADELVDRVLVLKFEIEGYMYVKGNKIAKWIQVKDADKSIKRLRELTGKIEGMTKSEVYGEVQEIVKDIEESTVLSDYEKAERKKAIARLILVILKNEVKKGEKVDLSELRGICDSKDIAHAIRLELIEMAREEKEDNESARKNFLELAQRVNQDEDLGICDPDIWEALTGVRGSVVIGQENKEQEEDEKDNSQNMEIAIYEGKVDRSALDIVKERMRKLLKLDTKCTLAILDKYGNIVGTEVKYTNLKRMPKKYKERLVEVEISAEVVPTTCFDYDKRKSHHFMRGKKSKYLKKIILTDEVKKLERGAFSHLRSLEEVKIGENIKEIPAYCFEATGLHELNIPSSVTSLGVEACSYCYGLREVNLEEGLKRIGRGCFMDSGLESLTIPDSVEELGESVCKSCWSLESVNIGSGITEIKRASFYHTGLIEIIVPGNVKKIRDGAFTSCHNLKRVNIEEGVEVVENSSFTDSDIEELFVDAQIIEGNAFLECNELRTVKIGENVRILCGFNRCRELQEMEIPGTVDTIGDGAFFKCEKLENVSIGNGVRIIGDSSFADTGIKEINVPPSVEEIGFYAFAGCPNLTSAIIGEGVTTIPEGCFKDSENLELVEHNPEATIMRYAFKGCEKLPTRTTTDSEVSDQTITGNEDPDDPDDPNRS